MKLGPGDQITLVRAVLVAVLASLAARPGTPALVWSAILIAIVALLLDGVDGWVARRTATASAFGMRFDTETDAALVLVLAVLTWRHGKAGPWILAAGLLRYGFVASGWIWPWMRRPLTPTLRGRLICIVQIGALIVALAPPIEPPVSTIIAAVGLTALCYSFFVDTLWLWRRAD